MSHKLNSENENLIIGAVVLAIGFLLLFLFMSQIQQITVEASFIGVDNSTIIYSLSVGGVGTIYNVTVYAGSVPINCSELPRLPVTGPVVITLKCPATGSTAIVRASNGTYSVPLPTSRCYTYTNIGIGINNC